MSRQQTRAPLRSLASVVRRVPQKESNVTLLAFLQETAPQQPNTLPVRIGALVLLVVIVAIIILRRKKKKKVEDEF